MLLATSGDDCAPVRTALEEVGLSVRRSELGLAALIDALEDIPVAVFLDARSDLAGAAQLCRSLRAVDELSSVHIVAVTNPRSPDARLCLYEAGADDCWTVADDPFLLASRVADLARSSPLRGSRTITCGSITLDQKRFTVTCWGRTAQLTAMQMKLLTYFMANPGVVFSNRQLLDQVWGNHGGDDRMVRAAILRLRRVLGSGPGSMGLIKTVRGAGYTFNPNGARDGIDGPPAAFTKR